MANRTVAKSIRLGYQLKINRTGEPGAVNWTRVGDLFPSSLAASEYRAKNHPDVTKYLIQGIRVDPRPIHDEKSIFERNSK